MARLHLHRYRGGRAVRRASDRKQKSRRANVYLAGISRDNDSRAFQNSLSGTTEATTRNWYMESVFGEARIAPVGVAFNTLIMAAAFVDRHRRGPDGLLGRV